VVGRLGLDGERGQVPRAEAHSVFVNSCGRLTNMLRGVASVLTNIATKKRERPTLRSGETKKKKVGRMPAGKKQRPLGGTFPPKTNMVGEGGKMKKKDQRTTTASYRPTEELAKPTGDEENLKRMG